MEKSERVFFRLAPAEKSALRRLAGEPRRMSATVRRLIREAAREEGCWPVVDHWACDHKPNGGEKRT